MALPKVQIPTFEIVQPSTNEKLVARPFLVKEEKILLMAKESGDLNDVTLAIKQIINNCILSEKFDVDNIPIFDMEFIFIQLRAQSVGNIVKFKVEDSDDGIEYDLEVDLHEVKVQTPTQDFSNKIMITENLGVVMKYITASIANKIAGMSNEKDVSNLVLSESIDYIFDEEEVYPWDQQSHKEKEEFIDSLSLDAYSKINEFFMYTPHIEHTVYYENSTGKKKKVVFRNLDDFFELY